MIKENIASKEKSLTREKKTRKEQLLHKLQLASKLASDLEDEIDGIWDMRLNVSNWKEEIDAAKGKKKQDLKRQFKEKFGRPYGVRFLEELGIEDRGKEEKHQALRNMAIQGIEDLIGQASADEKNEKEIGKTLISSEFESEARVIEQQREEVINTAVKKVARATGLTKVLDKILKGEPYFLEMDLEEEELRASKRMSKEEVDLRKDIPTDRDPSQTDDGFEEQILSQRKDVLEEIQLGKHKELSQEYEQVAWPEKEAPEDRTAEDILAEREQILKDIKEGARAEMAAAGVDFKEEPTVSENSPVELEQTNESLDDIQKSTETDNENKETEEPADDDTLKPIDNLKNVPENDFGPLFHIEVFDKLKSIGLSNKDLETIPGFDRLNPVSALMVAQSMKMLALEKAEKRVQETIAASFAGKNKVGRIFAGIANVFRQGKIERAAIAEQAAGGIAMHGFDLTRLVRWAETFQLETIKVGNKEVPDFIADLRTRLPYFTTEEQELLEDFNSAAEDLSRKPKYWQNQANEIAGKKVDEKFERYEAEESWYNLQYSKVRDMLVERLGGDREASMHVEGLLRKVDAKVNMVQFMTANPDLEKEWQAMTKNNSFFARLRTKENLAYFTGGGLSRMALVSTFGYVAAPLLAAAIGGWRGMIRSERAARKADRFIDKKEKGGITLNENNRRQVLVKINSLVPEEFRMEPAKWLATAAAKDKKEYALLKLELLKTEKKIAKEKSKSIERKTVKAEDLMAKTKLLVAKISAESDYDKRALLVSQLQRRFDYNYKLADRGLVDFGNRQDRAERMLDFYKGMDYDQRLLEYQRGAEGANYEIKWQNGKELKTPMIVDMEKRAQQLVRFFERSSETKLDQKRRRFIIKGMLNGATFGAAFAAAGGYVFGHFDNAGGEVTANIASGQQAAAEALDKVNDHIAEVGSTDVGAPGTMDQAAEMTTSTSEAGHVIESVPSSEAAESTASASTEAVESSASATSEAAETAASTVESGARAASETSAEETAAPATEAVAGNTFTDVISNEGLKGSDSVWRSVKEIFVHNAEKLGYSGDLSDADALAKWASTQTNEALANSGDITDKVFEGNVVSLEQGEDGLFVSVEAGEGAEPDFLPTPEDIKEVDVPASGAVSEQSVENIMPLDNEAWADAMGAKYGLSPEEVSFSDEGVIETNIGSNTVFINPVENTYIFFDAANMEHAGSLVDAANQQITDLKAFIAETIKNGVNAEAPLPGPEVLLNAVDLSEEGIKASADNIGRFITMHGATDLEELQSQVLSEIEKATNLTHLKDVMTAKENRIFEGLMDKIREGGYNQDLHQRDMSRFIERLVDRHGI